jgi:hypothetical protein
MFHLSSKGVRVSLDLFDDLKDFGQLAFEKGREQHSILAADLLEVLLNSFRL